MERNTHYNSILDRNKRIAWQEDCYVDLQSTPTSTSTKGEMEGKSHCCCCHYELHLMSFLIISSIDERAVHESRFGQVANNWMHPVFRDTANSY